MENNQNAAMPQKNGMGTAGFVLALVGLIFHGYLSWVGYYGFLVLSFQ